MVVAVEGVGVFAMVVVMITELMAMMTMTTIKIKQKPTQKIN